MQNIFVRMGVVIGVLIGVQVGYQYVLHLTNPEVVAPLHPLDDFPMMVHTETGNWTGKNEHLDEQEFNYAELSEDISRRYTNHDNHTLALLLGLYNQPSKGLYHNPYNCYHTHGFTQISRVRVPLKADNRVDTEVDLSVWEKDGQKSVVCYWYEVGDYTMFERQDLLATQFAMRGKTKWPAMFKVLIDVPASNVEQAKADALEMAKYARQWLGTVQPTVE